MGHDGRTANDRFRELTETMPRGYQQRLIQRCNCMWGFEPDKTPPAVSQQMISNWVKNKSDLGKSHLLVAVALALSVNPLWLQLGLTPRKLTRDKSRDRRDESEDEAQLDGSGQES